MQQDTLNSSNKFKHVIIVTLGLLVTNISTEDSVEINFTTISTSLEPTSSTITKDEIISSTPISLETTISITTEMIENSTTDEIVPLTSEKLETITQEEFISITTDVEILTTTEKTNISTKIIKNEDLKIDICALLNDCITCVKSSNSCTWLVNENACKSPDAASRNSTSGLVVENENYPGEVQRKGASFCPRIVTMKNITVPSDTHKMIKIKVSMKNLFMTPTRFTCRFGDGPEAITTSATLLVDTIQCSNAYFFYPSDEPFVQLPVSVLHSGNELSNPKDIKLIIYKCPYMADNCISCFSFERNYECGWCPGSSTCEIAGQCEETTVENLWIGRRGFCPQFTQ